MLFQFVKNLSFLLFTKSGAHETQDKERFFVIFTVFSFANFPNISGDSGKFYIKCLSGWIEIQ